MQRDRDTDASNTHCGGLNGDSVHRMSGIRVAIDASPLLFRSAGVKTYVHHWTQSLRDQAGANHVTLFPMLDFGGRFDHERSVAGAVGTISRLALLYGAGLAPIPLLDWFTSGCDIFHASHLIQTAPRKARLTTTLYDMTCWLMPENHSPANVKSSLRVADTLYRPAAAIIAISESARTDALRLLNLAPEKIHVIYPGVAAEYFRATHENGKQAALRYGISKPYALYVGTVEPRKNLKTLLDAWEGLPADARGAYDLVVAGAWGWGDDAILRRLKAGDGGVRYLGYVAEADLPALTAGAEVFVYPSLYEGFGLPLAQAMAAGVASITANVSSMPEVAGEAALLVDPRSPAELQAALRQLLESESLRCDLGERGRKRAQRFTWEDCARQSWGVFEQVAG